VTASTRFLEPFRPALAAALATAALAVAVLPVGAATQSYSYRVELAGTAKKRHAHAGNVDWECRGKYCIASARGGNVSVRGCRELVSQVGRVVSYRSEIKHLGGDQIDECNAVLASDTSPPKGAPGKAAGLAATAARPDSPPRVTTEELTFTGVHNWSPVK
jgi:hypothetical protein